MYNILSALIVFINLVAGESSFVFENWDREKEITELAKSDFSKGMSLPDYNRKGWHIKQLKPGIYLWEDEDFDDSLPTLEEEINHYRKKLNEPIHLAAACGNLEMLKDCVERQHIDVNKTNDEGWDPLHFACHYEHKDALSYLMKKKATIKKGFLEDLIILGSDALVKIILNYNPVIDEKKILALPFQNDWTYAGTEGPEKERLTRSLLLFGMFPIWDEVVNLGQLYTLLYRNESPDDRLDCFELDEDGNNLLPYAAVHGKKDVVNFLLNKKVNLLHKNKHNNSAYSFLVRVLKRKDLPDEQHKDCKEILKQLHNICLHYNRAIKSLPLPIDVQQELKKQLAKF